MTLSLHSKLLVPRSVGQNVLEKIVLSIHRIESEEDVITSFFNGYDKSTRPDFGKFCKTKKTKKNEQINKQKTR